MPSSTPAEHPGGAPVPGAPPAAPVDVILRDGSTLRLRPPARGDAEPLIAFFQALSDESLRLRFHYRARVDQRVVEALLEPDWLDRGALLGTLVHDGREHVVAVGSYFRLRDATLAEAAFTVADAYQHRGIGTRLLEQLAARAAAVGIQRFVAEVLEENQAMLGLFAAAGFEITRRSEDGEVEVRFPIAVTERFEAEVARRDHTAVTASLRPFFEPATVAVVGASVRRGALGGELFRKILEGDFVGAAYPVNRNGEPVAGVRGYRTIADIPDTVDLAVVAVPAAGVLEAAESALRHGVRALVVISAGFAESGAEGAARQEQLLGLVRAYGARLIGPNCLGISAAAPRLNATFAFRGAPPGNIALSSQSGALGIALVEAGVARGLGLSAFVSIGNKADVSTNDLLEWWEEDAATRTILMYVESFGNPRRFAQIARRVSLKKPIVALKSGTSATGQRAASSHTAALAGSEAGVDALFRQVGVIRADSLEELIDVASLFSTCPEPRGRRVAILTNAGGLGILCADACEASGLELPELRADTAAALRALLPAEATVANPVDMLASAGASTYAAALSHLLADAGVDAVIVLFTPTVNTTAEDVGAAIVAETARSATDKPVLASVVSAYGIPEPLRARDRRVAAFGYPESAARALGRAAQRAEWLRRPRGVVPALPGIDRDAARRVVERALARPGDGWLTPAEVRELLVAYGLPLVPERVVDTPDDAVAAARELGFPAVVKTAEPGVHKTERGGVVLDLRDEAAVRAAAAAIGGPVLVQPMVGGGAELLAGVVQDPVFGPLVAFGPGGALAELIGEAGFRVAPLTDEDARELVLGGKAGRLVRGFRGAPAADVEALVDLLLRLARLGEELQAVAELDLNPVLARPDGCLALDARVRVRPPEQRPRAKSW